MHTQVDHPQKLAAVMLNADTLDATVHGLAKALGYSVLALQDIITCRPRFDLLPYAETARSRSGLVQGASPTPSLLLTQAFDVDRMAWAQTAVGEHTVHLVSDATFDAWLAHCEAHTSALGALDLASGSAATTASSSEVINLLHIGGDDSPAVKLVNSTLFDALRVGASDIHLECVPSGLTVKFRIDGVLSTQRHMDGQELATHAVSRIKVMAQLDIAERRIPQDGRLQITFEGRAIDVRVSVMPSIHGEDVVLRILDRQHLAQSLEGLTLAKLGFNSEAITAIQQWSKKSHGMLLVTGPTGSGKTTTLYAAIAETHNPRDKIITIEDPVEYQLPGVLQIPVNERKGLTFALGLRSILRHDPDKILVGEIRDAETAHIAVQSALTGHLVFTTVHANNVFDVLGRFSQFDLDAYTFASAVNGIVAQRLLRKVCQTCATPATHEVDLPDANDRLALSQFGIDTGNWLAPRGCEHCRGFGYSGRFALAEVLDITPTMRGLLAAKAPLLDLQSEASKAGWVNLRTLALRAAAAGLTTIDEVNRVAS
jgi:general secretion pathway protein E